MIQFSTRSKTLSGLTIEELLQLLKATNDKNRQSLFSESKICDEYHIIHKDLVYLDIVTVIL